jgi:N,N'-diacetyllegionaminate synthase
MEKPVNFPATFSIGERRVGLGAPCLVIAEAGVNHFGSMEKAFRLVDMAAEAGADVFKIQHFYTDRLIGPSAPDWRDRMRPKELSEQNVRRIKEYCDKCGILFLCTPHDDWALRFLHEELDIPAIKVGSGEVENWPFLKQVAACAKPVILSTGMYRMEQIAHAAAVLEDGGCPALAVLHCVTSYPAPPNTVNLRVMDAIRRIFSGPVWRPLRLEPASSRSTLPLTATCRMHRTGRFPAIRRISGPSCARFAMLKPLSATDISV